MKENCMIIRCRKEENARQKVSRKEQFVDFEKREFIIKRFCHIKKISKTNEKNGTSITNVWKRTKERG